MIARAGVLELHDRAALATVGGQAQRVGVGPVIARRAPARILSFLSTFFRPRSSNVYVAASSSAWSYSWSRQRSTFVQPRGDAEPEAGTAD
jgi:hypothetical protein